MLTNNNYYIIVYIINTELIRRTALDIFKYFCFSSEVHYKHGWASRKAEGRWKINLKGDLKMAKKITKKESGINNVRISGVVSLVNYVSEKLFDGTIGVTEETPNGKKITHYIRCKWFNPSIELEKGDIVDVTGKFGTDSYETKDGKKKYSTIVIIESLEVFGE